MPSFVIEGHTIEVRDGATPDEIAAAVNASPVRWTAIAKDGVVEMHRLPGPRLLPQDAKSIRARPLR